MTSSTKISSSFVTALDKDTSDQTLQVIVVHDAPRRMLLSGLGAHSADRQGILIDGKPELYELQKQLVETYRSALGRSGQLLAARSVGGGILPAFVVEATRDGIEQLARQPDVRAIMPNQHVSLIAPRRVGPTVAAPPINVSWGLERLQIPALWEKTIGQGVAVCVIDTGVFGEHPAIKSRISEFIVLDSVGRRIAAPAFDSHAEGHGTHVCGVIAGGTAPPGVHIGVAPGADLMVAAIVFGSTRLSSVMDAFGWGIERGASIFNLSIGFDYFEPQFTGILDDLVDVHGAIPVVAIGNNNYGNSSSPGSSRSALAVGAVELTPAMETEVAGFSSGATLVFPDDLNEQVVTKPDLCAPGVNIYSCVPPQRRELSSNQFAYMDGTSMATPHVSGVVAALRAAKPYASARTVMQVLKETASHPSGSSKRPDNRWGYGLIQPLAALQAL